MVNEIMDLASSLEWELGGGEKLTNGRRDVIANMPQEFSSRRPFKLHWTHAWPRVRKAAMKVYFALEIDSNAGVSTPHNFFTTRYLMI